MLVQVEGGGPLAAVCVAAHERAPGDLAERVDAEQLVSDGNQFARGVRRFERGQATREHLDGALAEALAIGLDPLVVAAGQEVSGIQPGGLLQRGAIALEPASGGAIERVDVAVWNAAPPERAGTGLDDPLDLRPRLPQVVPLAPQVRQCLRVGGLGPEAAGNLHPRHRAGAAEHEAGEQLLLPRTERPRYRMAVEQDPEAAEELDAHQPRPMNGIFVAITVRNWTFASSGSPAM